MSTKTAQDEADIKVFKAKLGEYKRLIDEDIKAYSKQVQKSTLQQYGASARLVADAYLDILSRGGKRIRGSLVCLGYEMSGGIIDKNLGASGLDAGAVFSTSTGRNSTSGTENEERSRKTAASAKSSSRVASSAGEQATAARSTKMIVQAARAVEMVHAYLLIMDDIQDRSLTRRGGPTVPVILASHHRRHHLAGDPGHFGIAMALNAMGIGNHAAQMILANLDAPENRRLNVISILNRSIVITAHGQTNDIMNEVVAEVDEEAVERVLEWKTAHYTFLNPLHVGMVLAGADRHATDAITDYALHAGKAFQITDDILSTFGSEFESGKSSMDDMREGKRTVLSTYALDHAKTADKNFLIQMLGNTNLTPVEFERCKTIFIESGALKHSQDRAATHVEQALASLDKEPGRWSGEGVQFLRGLSRYLLTRMS